MKKTTIKKLLVYAFLVVAVLYAFRIKSVDSFLKNQNICVVAFLYSDTDASPHGGRAHKLRLDSEKWKRCKTFFRL